MKTKLKFLLCMTLVLVLIISTPVSASSPNINLIPPKIAQLTPEHQLDFDGSQSDWAVKELIEAFQYELTYDNIENNFKKPITREEFSTIAVKLYEKLSGKKAVAVDMPFNDTTNTEVAKAYGLGIVKGISADKFSPNLNITRQEISVMILRGLTAAKPDIDKSTDGSFPFDDASHIASWALDAMKFAYKNNIMKGTSTKNISPLNNTTREQAIILLKRTYVAKSGKGTLAPTIAPKDISPNFALNKIVPADNPNKKGTSSSVKITVDPMLKIAPKIPFPGVDGSTESPGFPLKNTDSALAGVQHLGRGYNIITSKYADESGLEYYVLDIKKLLNSGKVYKIDGSNSDSRYVEGNSASSYSQQLATRVGASGNYLFFSGSVSTNFSSSTLTEKNRSYATLIYEALKYRLYLDNQNLNLMDYMTTSFKNDIDKMDPVKLFETYGTHILKSLHMGGRLEYSASANSTYYKTESSLEVDTKAAFNTLFASAGVSVSSSKKEASSSFYSNSERNVKAYPAYGGTDLDPSAFNEWFNRLQKEPGISDFGKNGLIPIWQLASTTARKNKLENAFKEYAASKNYVQPEVTWGITGIKIQRYLLAHSNVPTTINDPATGDEWKLVSNIAAHQMFPSDELDYIYVREGFSNDSNKPPVVGVFMVNETQGEDPIAIFNQLYGDDPTARLWGYAGEMLPNSGLEYYINREGLGDKITLHYVTSLNKKHIKRLRVKHINPKNQTVYFPEHLATDASFKPVIDIGSYNKNGNYEPQNCTEGAPSNAPYPGLPSWAKFTVYRNTFIEYSYESQ
ncbi:MAG: S-layer homology domain-containing protein [Clostridia bacterium]|nr:S-layer homology domain-containing protein [Clostridia bacterium]